MDQKLMRRLHGSGRFREIAEAMYHHHQHYGSDPDSLWQLVEHLESMRDAGHDLIDQRMVDAAKRVASSYERQGQRVRLGIPIQNA